MDGGGKDEIDDLLDDQKECAVSHREKRAANQAQYQAGLIRLREAPDSVEKREHVPLHNMFANQRRGESFSRHAARFACHGILLLR